MRADIVELLTQADDEIDWGVREGYLRQVIRILIDKSNCIWTEDEDGNYETSCNNTYTFEEDFNYCPYCSNSIITKAYSFPTGTLEELE